MIEQTSLGRIKFWTLWAVDGKLIFILAVLGHYIIFLYQAE